MRSPQPTRGRTLCPLSSCPSRGFFRPEGNKDSQGGLERGQKWDKNEAERIALARPLRVVHFRIKLTDYIVLLSRRSKESRFSLTTSFDGKKCEVAISVFIHIIARNTLEQYTVDTYSI